MPPRKQPRIKNNERPQETEELEVNASEEVQEEKPKKAVPKKKKAPVRTPSVAVEEPEEKEEISEDQEENDVEQEKIILPQKRVQFQPPQEDFSAESHQEDDDGIEVHNFEKKSFGADPHVHFYKNIALGFLGVTIILFGAVFLLSLNKVNVAITTRPMPLNAESVVQVEKERSGLNSIRGEVSQWQETYSKDFKPQTVKEEPTIATGEVTLHNTSGRPQPLVATTRLLSKDGVLFRLKKAVTVPAQSTVKAEVYADQAGGSYNIEPTSFTIPGLPADKQKVIYAESAEPMKGGVKSIGILGEEDVKRAEEEFKKAFHAFVEDKARVLMKEYSGVFTVEQNLVVDRAAKIGTSVDSFTLTAKANVIAVGYDERELLEWSNAKLKEKAGGSKLELRVPEDKKPTFTFDALLDDAKGARLIVEREGELVLAQENSLISKDVFLGKTADQIKDYLGQVPGVYAVKIEFFPRWLKVSSRNPEKITISVTTQP